jgi:hypothetical protein
MPVHDSQFTAPHTGVVYTPPHASDHACVTLLLGRMAKVHPSAVAGFGSCASSGRAWRLWAAQHTQQEKPSHWAPSQPRCSSAPRTAAFKSRRLHHL